MRDVREKLKALASGLAMGSFALMVLGIFWLILNADYEWREHVAERTLGSDAVCGEPDDGVMQCVRWGVLYACVVSGDDRVPRVACAEVSR